MAQEKELLKREEMDPAFCWRLEDLFETDGHWEEGFRELEQETAAFGTQKGRLAKGPEELYRVLEKYMELQRKLERIYVYANQKYHQDMGSRKYQEMAGKAGQLSVRLTDAASFLEPEILALDEEKLKNWPRQHAPLKRYDRYLREELRMKPHILSEELEGVLAKAGDMAGGPQQIFMAFNNADIDFGTICDENGEETALTHGRYTAFLESGDRRVRRDAFRKLYRVYEEHKNTLAATFTANLKQAGFFASVRKYPSALAAALDGGNIPLSVYSRLIEAVHEKLPEMYRYVRLRKKLLGLDELHMYDVYVPLAAGPERKISFEEAKAMVKEGLSVLGPDYTELLEKGFAEGWLDVYENKGKRSGAYSWGAYGTHPYVLLNYSGNLNSVFTLAHEMGHALHSYYSDSAQPYVYAGYRIFVAEVASTCNEALLIHDLLEKARSREEKAYLINYFLDQFRGTLYRQTMFAEFERAAHERQVKEGSFRRGPSARCIMN